nr:uncharacterized protein LOC124816419 isoform X1 [Hydra vulgaris]XP_047141618.1 uncharacterized protein LOC124816419 isoform X1 [Hydra vulgaris]XP_047141619.1 uncharacterized protein LOC124816419 isoform X1 [Hydra vulgaris]XP_047141620.1 uncharacterized protein LOC124816419 isoform X1 [Hydra vulgaris]XP_047141621.1 uncharacterized protein LOC124816419 isoform X1 [Hydra vulgaris]
MLALRTHSHGVKANCCLNKIPGFHVVENFALDPMHTLLEGVVPFELGCILYHLIKIKHFSLLDLNTCMHQFFDRNSIEKSKRPPTICQVEKPGGGLTPLMKSVQMWSLLKYLPMIIGRFVREDDGCWLFLLNLCELVDLIFAPKFTKGMIAYLRVIISDHLLDFKDLFGKAAKLRPKHHFLVHFPTIIIKNGPLVGMSCLRYEMKNSFFKRSANVVCNFINICKTLAYRHQCNSFYSRFSKQYLRTIITVGNKSEFMAASLAGTYHECLCIELGIEKTEIICIALKLNVDSVLYCKGHCFVIGRQINSDPVFGEVVAFVSLPYTDKWYIVLHLCITEYFDSHFHAYVMSHSLPAEFKCISIVSLCDHNPLFNYLQPGKDNKNLIRLPYHIVC